MMITARHAAASLCLAVLTQTSAGQDAWPKEPGEKSTPVFAFVALESSVPPTEQTLRDALAKSFPEGAVIGGVEIEAEERSLSFTVDGKEFLAAPMGKPIPWGDLAEPCASNWRWPEATEAMRAHRDHYLVLSLSRGDTLTQAISLTKAIAAVTRCTKSVGVYWGHGPTVIEPTDFQEFADGASIERPPVLVFLGLRMGKTEKGFSAVTTGMDFFGKKNVEVIDSVESPNRVMSMVLGLAIIVLQGEEVPDGDTIGPDTETKVLVRHKPSAIGRAETVYRIEY